MSTAAKPGLVSIIVASYNHATFLTQRMESLIHQTYQDIEILVIDDCSTDNSVEILRKYESHPKVKLLVREQNGGWVTVSNQGVEMSAGEFVIFANCDDDCDPRMIERLVIAMQTSPSAGIAFCRSLMIDENNKVLGDDYAAREGSFKVRCANDTLLTGKEMSRFLLHSCVIPNLSAALIRRECFTRVGKLSSEYRVCCDWDLFFRIVTIYDVAYIAEPLNKFRQHSMTIRSSTKGRVMYAEFFSLLLSQLSLLRLSFYERCKLRVRVMDLWLRHALSAPLSGFLNFKYHCKLIFRLDSIAILFLPIALVLIVISGFKKVFKDFI